MVHAHGYEPAYTGLYTVKLPLVTFIMLRLSGPPLFAKTAGKGNLFETAQFWNNERAAEHRAIVEDY